VDGPAASGKGTLARKLAAHYGLPHLDTGLLYRAVGQKLLEARQQGSRDSDKLIAIHAAQNLSVTDLARNDLGTEGVGRAASIISAIPEVRDALLQYQFDFADQEGGAVLDGRDIGTVICPDADVKLFITASAEVRAKRRYEQQKQTDASADYQSILTAILERDERDSTRTAAPLTVAEDAVSIDSSDMSIDAVFAAAIEVVERIPA
jgi:cytidylate kinase